MKHAIAIVDDHHLVRNALITMINGLGEYEVTLEASQGQEFIESLSLENIPHIAIIDLHMPVMDGYSTIAWLVKNHDNILPLALTLDVTDDALTKALQVGARGLVRKNARPQVLKTALDSLILTGYYHTDEIQNCLRQNPELKTREEKKQHEVLSQITPREMEFLKLVCHPDEFTYDQIGDKMGISRRTVDHFRKELFEKFDIKSKAGLVLFAVKWKIAGI